ncbi:MAG: hypothetical protein D6798_02210 [Deltaproteobacteria bacterium]|nr:MAG: hypothetical protein D6798_02210 [Deltaproteobacteria bacterium]
MRLMVAGLSNRDGRLIFKTLGKLVEPGGTLQDWRQLERAVEQAQPDVVLLYLGQRPGQTCTLARRVLNHYPALQIVGLVEKETPGLVELSTEAGLVDLVILEHGQHELNAAFERLHEARLQQQEADGDVLALLGAKGGVGTTTVAVNLGAELAADRNKRVIVVDLHLYLGDVAAALDLAPDPSVLWFLGHGSTVDAKMWRNGPPMHRTGFQILGVEGDLGAAEPVTAEQVVFLVDSLRRHYDYVVMDCGSNLTEVSLAGCSAADQRLIVVTDELAALLGARRRVLALHHLDLDPPVAYGLLNRATEGLDMPAIEEASGLRMVSTIRNAWRDVHGAMERAQVLREAAPHSDARMDIADLARSISGTGVTSEARRKRAFFSLFR